MAGILTGKFVGVETILVDLTLYSDTIRSRVKSTVYELANEMVSRARGYAPFNKGRLESSIAWSGMATEKRVMARVGTDVFYGRFQESGWTPNPKRGSKNPIRGQAYFGKGWKRNPRNQAGWKDYSKKNVRKIYARPFLKPALEDMRSTISERLLDAVEGAKS